jgi:hypothetical protein
MLADEVDFVVGVDTHRDSHTAAVANPSGAVQSELTVVADPRGYRRLLHFAQESAPGRRCWAIESTGSFGAGLAAFLLERGERVIEVDRPRRPARRNGAKSDPLDAARAAREALTREHLASPRQRGRREAIRVLLCTRDGAMVARTKAITHLKALLVSAPSEVREDLRRDGNGRLLARRARLRRPPVDEAERRATILALRATARRAIVRYRLNRALHTIAISRLRHDPATQAYAARRAREGKTARDTKRCLKRYLARQIFRMLEADPGLVPLPQRAA